MPLTVTDVWVEQGGVKTKCKRAAPLNPPVWVCPFCQDIWSETFLLQTHVVGYKSTCGRDVIITTIGSNQGGFEKMSGNARIWWDSQISAYRMTSPFNPQFNELFKNLIPFSDRNWDKETKIWTITERYFAPTKTLLDKMFGNVQAITKEMAEKAAAPPPVKTLPIDGVLMSFMKLLPYEAAQKAYRAAAIVLHPDRGGDMEKMANLNACWQRLEIEFYKVKTGN